MLYGALRGTLTATLRIPRRALILSITFAIYEAEEKDLSYQVSKNAAE